MLDLDLNYMSKVFGFTFHCLVSRRLSEQWIWGLWTYPTWMWKHSQKARKMFCCNLEWRWIWQRRWARKGKWGYLMWNMLVGTISRYICVLTTKLWRQCMWSISQFYLYCKSRRSTRTGGGCRDWEIDEDETQKAYRQCIISALKGIS